MLHEPAAASGPDPASAYKGRLGAWLFLAYSVVYAGFMAVGVINGGSAMQIILFWGLNIAVIYGFGLIILALVLALIYNLACTREERRLKQSGAAP